VRLFQLVKTRIIIRRNWNAWTGWRKIFDWWKKIHYCFNLFLLTFWVWIFFFKIFTWILNFKKYFFTKSSFSNKFFPKLQYLTKKSPWTSKCRKLKSRFFRENFSFHSMQNWFFTQVIISLLKGQLKNIFIKYSEYITNICRNTPKV
jgi:hypothetical protein